MTAGLVQPQSSPLTMPRVRTPSMRAEIVAPSRSGTRRRPGARLSTRARLAATTAAMPNGRLTRNARRQLPSSTSAPPIGGPRPEARAADAPQRPMAWARLSVGNASTTRASDAGTRIAAPRACTTRNAMSTSTFGAMAQRTDAIVKSVTPLMKARLRPSRSARRPETTRNAANTMLYALRIHESVEMVDSGNDSRMLGNATLTIVASRKARNAPNEATRRTVRDETRGRTLVSGSAEPSVAVTCTAIALSPVPRRGACHRHRSATPRFVESAHVSAVR